MNEFFAELKRRHVIRIAVFYGAGAWLILQVADVVLEVVEAPEGSLRLVAILLALGFPFALILAWAFEITPEGIKRDSAVDRSKYDSGQAARKLDIATISLLTVAILLLLWDNFGGREDRVPLVSDEAVPVVPVPDGPRDLSIAVLPFVNMSVDPENEYFSEGLSEELLNVLARMDDFRVAGRTSSFAFKGQSEDLRAIGERLNVANILEGSVRKQGDQIRVTAQLIDARSGYHLWSDTYDRRLDDVFAIQDEIATEVVKALRLTLLAADEAVISQTAKGDVEAYNHYLRGQFHVRLRTQAGLERALEEFQQAILIDPNYAPPYAGIAMVYALFDNYGYRPLAETGPQATRAIERALELDPRSDEAWAVRGLLLGQGPGAVQRRPEAREALERAIGINPNNAFAHLWLASTLHPDFEAVRSTIRRAYQLDPLSPVILFRRVMEAVYMRDDAAFRRFERELKEVAPDWFMTWQAAGNYAIQSGEVADAALAFERALMLNPEYSGSAMALASALNLLGFAERAESLLIEYAEESSNDFLWVVLANVRAGQAVEEGNLANAVARYRDTLDAVDDPDALEAEPAAELALLELRAGERDAAERRLRARLRIGEHDLPDGLDVNNVLTHLALAYVLAERGEDEGAMYIARDVQRFLGELVAQGLKFPYIPLGMSYADHLEGKPGALEAGLSEAMRQGFRAPPDALRWLMPRDLDAGELERMVDAMRKSLAEERARYESARG
jgi:TolB-like protein/Tfp pilus assembly protein PilF